MRRGRFQRWLTNLPISTKTMLPIGLLVITMLLVTFSMILVLGYQLRAWSAVNELIIQRRSVARNIELLSTQVQGEVYRIAALRLTAPSEGTLGSLEASVERNLRDLNLIYGEMTVYWELEPEEREILERMAAPLDRFGTYAHLAVQSLAENPSIGVLMINTAGSPFAEFQELVEEYAAYTQRFSQEISSEVARQATRSGITILLVTLLISLLLIRSARKISRLQIVQPLLKIKAGMLSLAAGELESRVPIDQRSDEIGEMVRALEVFRANALEKLAAEASLTESEANYRAIFDNASDAVLVFSGPQGAILDVNARALEMYGVGEDEMRALTFGDLSAGIAPYSAQEALDYLQGALEGQARLFRWWARQGSGHFFWAMVSLKPVTLGGQRQVLATVRDIDQRVRDDEELQRYREGLERLVEEKTREYERVQDQLIRNERLAALGELAGSVGHELRNPLGVITNALYLLRSGTVVGDERARTYLELIEAEVRNADRIIHDLLSFAAIRDVKRRPVSCAQVVEHTLEKFSLGEGIELQLDLDRHTPQIEVSVDQLTQVLINLLQNAEDAQPTGGIVRLTAREKHGGALIEVSDGGPGISAAIADRLFEPLVTTKPSGIGLGLAICKRLVEANHGEIGAANNPDLGATFSIFLPGCKPVEG